MTPEYKAFVQLSEETERLFEWAIMHVDDRATLKRIQQHLHAVKIINDDFNVEIKQQREALCNG